MNGFSEYVLNELYFVMLSHTAMIQAELQKKFTLHRDDYYLLHAWPSHCESTPSEVKNWVRRILLEKKKYLCLVSSKYIMTFREMGIISSNCTLT